MKTPARKTAKPATDLVALARTGTDLDALDAGLAEARGQIETATRDRDAAEASYRERILDASPAELEQIQATKARAVVDLDRAEALTAALTRRIASVRDDRERDARRAQHADAVAKCDAIRQRLPAEYRRHALALRGLLRDLAEAEVARELAESLQAEFGAIPPVEDELRRLVHVPEEIVSQEPITLWVIDGRAEPLPAEKQAEVQAGNRPNQGYLYTGDAGKVAGRGGQLNCTRRRFTRTRYRAAIATPWTAASLLNTVSLPAFDVHSEDFVTAEQFRSPHTVLAHLERDLPEPAELARPVLERFEMVADTPRDDGPAQVAQHLRSVA
ncbi:hypothetical protein [Methylobacterium sp. 391_Methyba4]|uniref:hypothetical protein n=1 Tax=Methylobacterium sp. 391_Methyba4 TaxID=3038924 RepID=UPI00241E9605|nr:hypothetical protein [Methylobacterium sp. 391_Methyba4]WFS07672.1 hypothetical protein P9K36_30725 [Methylobacterium sp. 391_Methyba4]